MLVLSRKVGEQIVIDEDITIEIVEVRGDRVRVGVCAPKPIRVDRAEVHQRRMLELPAADGRHFRPIDTRPPADADPFFVLDNR